jgi:glycerol kinase
VACILAFDEGTTSARAIVFDRDGTLRAVAQKEIQQFYPKPGWVEHDPEEIWVAQSQVAIQALRSAGVSARDVAAVGITNQRETTLLWDRKTGAPIHHAIVWQDRRTAPMCDRLRADGCERMVQERTGLLLDA